MGIETAETLMYIGEVVAITGFGFIILYFLFHRPVEDDASERMDPMESPVIKPIEDSQRLAEIDAILSGDEAATAEPSETIELPAPSKRPRRAKLAPHVEPTCPERNPRWERPEIEVGTEVVAFSPPNEMRIENRVGIGRVRSRGTRRARIDFHTKFRETVGDRRTMTNLMIATHLPYPKGQ